MVPVGLVLFEVFYLSHDPGEDIGDWLVIGAADSMQERVTGFDVELYGGYPCAVLSPVMLLFHQKIQLVQAI